MANETGLDSTGISGSVPAWLRKIALEARYAKKRVWSHCFNAIEGDPEVQGKITKAGDRVTIQIFPSFTATDISTTDGSSTDTETSPTQKSVTINKWKNVSATLVDIVDRQSIIDWETNFAKGFGGAIATVQEDDLLALVAALTTNVDTSGGSMTDAKVRAAMGFLDDLEVPKDERCWGLCPQAALDLLGLPRFSEAQSTGFAKGVQVDNGRLSGLYGAEVEVTSRITTTSSKRDNVLFHREAFGVITQKDFTMEKFGRTQYATRYGGSALYGVATLRDNHAAWVSSAT